MANPTLKIVIEEHVPFVRGLLEPYAQVEYLPAEAIGAAALKDASALITRTRTRCDAALLEGSKCRIIATATIGTDHIDLEYCSRRGITVANAPGCNAPAVAQYVFASLMQVVNRPLAQHTIGILGVGHVGSIVEQWARSMGMRVLLCDPPRQMREGGDQWVDPDTIAREADIITFHTPLEKNGAFPTYHLADREFFQKLKRAPIIINSARGAIVDTGALRNARNAGLTGPLVIDCWENEPEIDRDLLAMASIATPHIAGYSLEGKVRASQTALDAVTTFLMLPRLTVPMPAPAPPARTVTPSAVLKSYDPMADTLRLKENPKAFEDFRNHYALRPETPAARDD